MNLNIIYLFLLIFCVNGIYSAQRQCYRCLSLNSECDPNYSVCEYGGLCVESGNTNRCESLPDVGGNCTLTDECKGEYDCDNGVCVSNNYLGLGENCTIDDNCSGNLVCQGGTCKNTAYPKCGNRDECNINETCSSNSCVAPLADGDSCSSSLQCKPLSSCLGTPSVCTLPFSSNEGGVCAQLSDCDISQELLCINSRCTSLATILQVQCSATVLCPRFTYCQCNTTTSNEYGTCKAAINFDDISKDKYIDYVNCIRSSNCPFVEDLTPESCIYKKCGADPMANVENFPCSNSSFIQIASFNLVILIILYISQF